MDLEDRETPEVTDELYNVGFFIGVAYCLIMDDGL